MQLDEFRILKETIASAGSKLRQGMLNGPEGENVVLTPAEATVIYRILTEQIGLYFK